MSNQLAAIDKGAEKGLSLADLRAIGARAYLAGGPVFGLVVITLFAIALVLSSIAMRPRTRAD